MADIFRAAAEAAADAAGAILRQHFRSPIAVDLKADESPVTLADREAEQAMRAVLGGLFPSHDILGEEAGIEGGGARYRWVLDPIDGTRAFITGRPIFASLIALLDHGRPILGVIDQPITGERWLGMDGAPTRFRGPFGGEPRTRHAASLAACELSATSPGMFDAASRPRFHRLAAAARRVSYGGDGYAYGLLALGQIDIIAEADLKIWDWAALGPIIAGAGGCITDWTGAPLRPDGDGRVLALGNPALLASAVATLHHTAGKAEP